MRLFASVTIEIILSRVVPKNMGFHECSLFEYSKRVPPCVPEYNFPEASIANDITRPPVGPFVCSQDMFCAEENRLRDINRIAGNIICFEITTICIQFVKKIIPYLLLLFFLLKEVRTNVLTYFKFVGFIKL